MVSRALVLKTLAKARYHSRAKMIVTTTTSQLSWKAFRVSPFSEALSATDWRVGWVLWPESIIKPTLAAYLSSTTFRSQFSSISQETVGEWTTAALALLEKLLSMHTFIVGERITIADDVVVASVSSVLKICYNVFSTDLA